MKYTVFLLLVSAIGFAQNNQKLIDYKNPNKTKQELERQKLQDKLRQDLEAGNLSLERLEELEDQILFSGYTYYPHSNTHPYIPHKWDYGIELGNMWIDEGLYWLGGNYGYNIGTCILTESQSCQQYFDVLLGASGRSGESNYYALLSYRWQFVNFPSPRSPVARIFTGVMHRIKDNTTKQFPVIGVGYGVTTYLHERADIRVEGRLGYGEEIGSFFQMFISVELKVARWLNFFAGKIRDVGVGTVETTGKIIKSGAKATGSLVEAGAEGLSKGVEAGVKAADKGIRSVGDSVGKQIEKKIKPKTDNSTKEKKDEKK
ncbi:MAG: hypothetical protein AB8E15_01240 [Bdellovibrionales bacterium]